MKSLSDLNRLPHGTAFHHIGYATASIDLDIEFFGRVGYNQEGVRFSDHVQGVAGCFLVGAGPRIELLENLPGSDTLTPWLQNSSKMYHIAYEVSNLDGAIAWAREQRGVMTVSPVPAVAFGGRKICFFLFRRGPMIEFIEN